MNSTGFQKIYYFLSTQRRGLRRRKRQEVNEKEDRQELQRQARMLQLSQGCLIQGTRENLDCGVGFHSTEGAEVAKDQSYPHDKNGEGYRKMNNVLKG